LEFEAQKIHYHVAPLVQHMQVAVPVTATCWSTTGVATCTCWSNDAAC